MVTNTEIHPETAILDFLIFEILFNVKRFVGNSYKTSFYMPQLPNK